MVSPRARSLRCGLLMRLAAALALGATGGARLCLAAPLRVFEGEYVITTPVSPDSLGARSSSDTVAFSGGIVEFKERLEHNTHLVSAKPWSGSLSLRSSNSRKLVDLDSKDPTCSHLIRDGIAQACSPNYELRVATVAPNDPSFSQLWGLSTATGIDAPRAWNLSQGSRDVVVAVIDTGIDYTHPDLAQNLWMNPQEIPGNGIDDDANGYVDDVYGVNTISGAPSPGDPMDDNSHGTHVAGTIGAEGNNSIGVVGINQQVRLMALKFLDAGGSGSTSDAIKAIDYLVAMKNRGDVNVRVVNNSWGGGGFSAPLKAAIERANAAGIIFVAAAGNSNSDLDASPSYPASYEVSNVVSVAAITMGQQRASYSNYGATSVHIAAPGSGILSTTPGNTYSTFSGTSMATPHVTGALGLLLGYQPSLTNAQVIQRLLESGREIPGLVDRVTGLRLVSSKRTLDVARMLYNETAPLAGPDAGTETCQYAVQTRDLFAGGALDTDADAAPLVNTSDEGGFYPLELPFAFQFFSETITRVYLSPNGVIYKRSPSGADYNTRDRAPSNSIAVLHTDLIPRTGAQGVRVASSKDKVTIVWSSEVYSYPGMGVVTSRATLRPNGEVSASVGFVETGGVGSLRRLVLGDPFSSPVMAPGAVMGIAGPTSANAFTVDLASTIASLGIGSSSPVLLGATYSPLCVPRYPDQDVGVPSDGGGGVGGGSPDESATVSAVRLRRLRRGATQRLPTKFSGSLEGSGSDVFRITVAIDRKQCEGLAAVSLIQGRAQFAVEVPWGVSRLSVSTAGHRATAFLPSALSTGSRLSVRGHARACRSVLRSLR